MNAKPPNCLPLSHTGSHLQSTEEDGAKRGPRTAQRGDPTYCTAFQMQTKHLKIYKGVRKHKKNETANHDYQQIIAIYKKHTYVRELPQRSVSITSGPPA